MGIRDALTNIDDSQAYTGAAVSQRSLDLGDVTPKRVLAMGEPMAAVINAEVAADCTTVKCEVIMTTDAALTAGIVVLVERTVLAADLAAGLSVVLPIPPIPPAAGWLRYLGTRITPAGGNATVTCSVHIVPLSMAVQKPKDYAKGYTIS